MKKVFRIFGAVAAIAALAACNKEVAPEIPENIPEGYVKVTLTAQQGTKTTMESNGDLFWSEDDAIAVVYNGTVCKFDIDNDSYQTKSASASFIGYAPVGVEPSEAYYPFVEGQALSAYGKVPAEQIYQEYSFDDPSSFDTHALPMKNDGQIVENTISFKAAAAVVLIKAAPVSGNVKLAYGSKEVTLKGVDATGKDLIFFVDGLNQTSFTLDGIVYNTGKVSGTDQLKPVVDGKRYILNPVTVTVDTDKNASLSTSQDSSIDKTDDSLNAIEDKITSATTNVTGVTLTTEANGSNPAGVQAVVNNASSALGANLKDADKVNVHVDVKVTPYGYDATAGAEKISFDLKPVATVTTYKNGAQTGSTTTPVTNEMIDQNVPIVVNIYTGFAPKQIVHKKDDGTEVKTYGVDEFTYNAETGVATLTVSHFSYLEVLGEAAEADAKTYVAQIGTVKYETLAEAVAAATFGQTITLLKNLENTGAILLKAGVTLDGDGHKISGNTAIHINAAGGTVKNVVFENIHNTSAPSTSDITKYNLAKKVGTLSAVYAESLTGELSITGCSFDNVDWDAIQITPIEGCTINIIDNTFTHTNTETSQLRYVHIETATYINAVVIVTDNKFYDSKSDYIICDLGVYKVRKSKDARLCGNWLETITNYDMTYPEMIYPARSQADVDVDDICPAAKKVVTPIKFYDTLQEAFDELVDFQLVKNTDEDVTVPANYNKQLQTDGFCINSTITNNGALFIIASNSDEVCTGKVINNGSLKSSNLFQLNGLQIVNNGKFEITGSTNAADLSKITNNEGGIIEISGGTFSSKPNDDWILWGFEAVDNGDGTFTVQKRTFADDEEALAAGAVAKYTKSSVTEYINTLANGGTSSLHFLKDITEDVVRTGSSSTYFYADNFKYIGSLDATGKTVYLKSGKAEFNSLKCSAFNVGATNTAGVEVKVHDGKVTGKITIYSPAKLTIDGGLFTNTSTTAAVAVNSGATLTITGGTFKSIQFKGYIPDGYKAVDNEDGTYTVTKDDTQVTQE